MQQNVSWPGWETVRLIGQGSFGAVYEIQRNVFRDIEKAALKVISIPQNASDIDEMHCDGYDDESITSTFQSHLKSIVAEYSLMRKMNGSVNIVNCNDIRYVQHDDGIGWDIFIKMELLTPLTKALPAVIPEETVLKIAKDMCAALELCKQHDIVHRDIKPQNIFVSKYGDYKLGDFGIAKTVEKTMGGTKIGTYKYMAPEVYNNQPYGAAADIYSLGLVLYWLLNERRMPFLPLPPEKLRAGMDETARNRRLSGEQIQPPAHGSEDLKKIVLKACAYDPKKRYATAAEMLRDLNEGFAGGVIFGKKEEEARLQEERRKQKEERLRLEREEQERCRKEQEEIGRRRKEKEENELAVENLVQDTAGTDDPVKAEQKNRSRKWKTVGILLLIAAVIIALLQFCGNNSGDISPQDNNRPPLNNTSSEQTNLVPTTEETPSFVVNNSQVSAEETEAEQTEANEETSEPTEAPDQTKRVKSISVANAPSKSSYFTGEELSTKGLSLKVVYRGGDTETITKGFTCSPTVLEKAGKQTITVSYGGKTTSFTVNVSNVELSGITIQKKPNKTSYIVGDTLDTSGIVLKLSYSDGSSKTVSSGFTCSPNSLQNVGTQKINVIYGGYSASFSVEVKAVTPVSMSIYSLDTQLNYLVGDYVSTSGVAVKVLYNNGSSAIIGSGLSFSPNQLTSAGTQRVTVSYGGLSTYYNVSVDTPSITLSKTDVTMSMDCWDSYSNSSRQLPLWKLPYPEVSTYPSGLSVTWELVQGTAYLTGDYIAAQQPGTIVAVAKITYNGYTYYSQNYTVRFSIYKRPTATNYIMSSPAKGTTVLGSVPAGVTVGMSKVSWDWSTKEANGSYWLWGKVTYNGVTGWIVIS